MYKLRELSRKDISRINVWRNDTELISSLGAPFRYINMDVDNKWFDNYMANRGNTLRCAIVDESDEILGLISLTSINYVNQSAELHIMIGDKEKQGRGIGYFAVTTLLQHAFQNMNLRRIELTVLEENKRAQRLYEKCGFVLEGTKRQAVFKNGKFIDMRMYAIIREENEHMIGGG